MKKGRVVQYMVAFAVSLTSVAIGATAAWPTPVIAKFHENSTGFQISDTEIAWMLAFSSPGFVSGSLATRFLADNVGRKATILISSLPIMTGTIIVTMAAVGWLLCLARFLWGVTTGIVATVSSIYLSEISDKDIRGTLVLFSRFMFNFGNLLVMAIGSYVSYDVLNYMLLVLPVLYLKICCWIPESPYFYLKERKVDAARRSLSFLRRYLNEEELEEQLQAMQAEVQKDMSRDSSVKEFFTGKRYRKALHIAIGLKLLSIFCGLTAIQSYLGRIMYESKSHMTLSTVFIIFGAVKFLVGIMSSALVDRINRRPLLILSYLGTGLSLLVVAAYFFCLEVLKMDHELLSRFGILTFLGIVAANVISTLGFYSTSSVIIGEIFPLNVRAIANTGINILGGAAGFSVARGFQAVKDGLGLCGVFSVFGTVGLIGAIFSFFILPETKGKSLMEIQRMLQGDMFEDGEEKKIDENIESTELSPLKTNQEETKLV